MNKKTLMIIIGVAILLLIISFVFKPHPAPSKQTSIFGQPAPAVAVAQPHVAVAAAIPTVESADQKIIDSYSTQIAAGKTDNGDAYLQRGLAYFRMKQMREAMEDFNAALKLAPKSAIILYSRALVYRQENMLDKAIADLDAAIAAKKDYAQAFNVRGLIYVDQQDYTDALADYNSAIALNPKDPDVYYNLGALYALLKKYDDATAAFTKAINANVPPANASPDVVAMARKQLFQTYLSRATVEVEAGDFKSALADATYVVTYDPKSVEALKVRSGIYDKMGNSAAAAIDDANANTLSMQNMLDGGK